MNHAIPYIIAAVIVAMLLGVVALAVAERRRRRQLVETFARLGGTINADPDPQAADEALRLSGLFRDLKTGPVGVRWCARVEVDGLAVRILEHRYSTGSGKNRTIHDHTIVSLPCPPTWPVLTLDREHLLHKVANLLGHNDLQLDDPAFNARWRVRTDDENFAIVLLSPEIQTRLMTLPKRTAVRVGAGAVSLGWPRRLRPAELEPALRWAADLWHALPPELRQTASAP